MLAYTFQRLLLSIPTIFVISVLSFVLIQLPPGDFLTSYAATLAAMGEQMSGDTLQLLREAYGLDQPIYVQYYKWVWGILSRGDFGLSLEWRQPVASLIWERMGLTIALTLSTLLFTWLLAIPIGIYSATNQYSFFDYLFTTIGFIGLGVPGFMLALVVMWLSFSWFGADVGGLFSDQYKNAPWSIGRVWDLMKHLWVPMLILGMEGAAGLIRTMRANLLDELHKPYVTAARARGLDETVLTYEYPVQVALNPFISTLGWALPGLVNGGTIISVTLSLPTAGPLLLRALQSQDMYLAGAFILVLGTLTILGTLISDLLLAWIDPRIRLDR
ncbi:MAG: ABC transporter permease [Proteobacteria bacterium]|jgi:peptide/nickel transport system permease protein|nr:ABC transporter permease [Pseudomonadota bacterium]